VQGREIGGLLLDLTDCRGYLLRQLVGLETPEALVLHRAGPCVDAPLRRSQRLENGADADEQLVELVIRLDLVPRDLHAVECDLAALDPLREVLDMDLALFVKRAHDVEK
jgi:hypothetical protein